MLNAFKKKFDECETETPIEVPNTRLQKWIKRPAMANFTLETISLDSLLS
jgi:hypothetical protein